MTISIYSGLPGSGKSYTVVSNVIIPALKEKRKIFTNIPLDGDAIEADFNLRPTHFETKDITDNPRWFDEVLPAGALLILDEAWRLWPSGLKANRVEASHKAFLAEHRHRVGDNNRSTEIVLVSQDAAQLAAFVRQLIEKTYRAKKLDVVGQSNRYRLDIYEGAVTGANPPLDKRIREIYGEYKPDIYRLYQSHTQSQTGEAGNEDKADKRANVLKGGTFKAILVALVILPILVFLGARNLYDKYHPKKINQTAQATSAASAQAPAPAKPKNTFFDGKDLTIVYNNVSPGQMPDIHIAVKGKGRRTVLDIPQLSSLGFTLAIVNECLVRVIGEGVDFYVMCSDPDYRSVVSSVTKGITGQDATTSM